MSKPNETTLECLQNKWIEFAKDLRESLKKQLPRIDSMDGTQIGEYVDGCMQAMWLEMNVQTFEKSVQTAIDKLPFDDDD